MKKQSTKIIAIILCAVFVLLLLETYHVRNNLMYKHDPFLTHRRKPVSENDISYISAWMTFDYINQLFNLPKDYLKETMNINDPKYPSLTIAQYAKRNNLNPGLLILSTEEAVRNYISQIGATKQ